VQKKGQKKTIVLILKKCWWMFVLIIILPFTLFLSSCKIVEDNNTTNPPEIVEPVEPPIVINPPIEPIEPPIIDPENPEPPTILPIEPPIVPISPLEPLPILPGEGGGITPVAPILPINPGDVTGVEPIQPVMPISPQDPNFELPTDLKATLDDKLESVNLPKYENGILEWKDENQILTESGTHEFDAIFTPFDFVNFKVLETKVDVLVEAKFPNIEDLKPITPTKPTFPENLQPKPMPKPPIFFPENPELITPTVPPIDPENPIDPLPPEKKQLVAPVNIRINGHEPNTLYWDFNNEEDLKGIVGYKILIRRKVDLYYGEMAKFNDVNEIKEVKGVDVYNISKTKKCFTFNEKDNMFNNMTTNIYGQDDVPYEISVVAVAGDSEIYEDSKESIVFKAWLHTGKDIYNNGWGMDGNGKFDLNDMNKYFISELLEK
jgi:hypothetical protein